MKLSVLCHLDKNFSSQIKKRWSNSTPQPMRVRRSLTSRRNSPCGFPPFHHFFKMTPILEKTNQKTALTLNWSTGEAECKRSPTGTSNSRARTSSQSRSPSRDISNTKDLAREEEKRTLLSALWSTTDLISYSQTNSTKPKTMSNT